MPYSVSSAQLYYLVFLVILTLSLGWGLIGMHKDMFLFPLISTNTYFVPVGAKHCDRCSGYICE